MPLPQVSDRIKELPGQALRAVFTGVGQLLLAAEKVRAQLATPPEDAAQPPAAASPEPAAPPAAAPPAAAPPAAAPPAAAPPAAAPRPPLRRLRRRRAGLLRRVRRLRPRR